MSVVRFGISKRGNRVAILWGGLWLLWVGFGGAAEDAPFLDTARHEIGRGNLENALTVLENGLSSSPEEGRGRLLEGWVRGELGDYRGAVRAYQRAREQLPLLGDCTLLLLGDLALEFGYYGDAEAAYRSALDEYPNSPYEGRLRLGLGRAANRTENWPVAERALKGFLESGGSDSERSEALWLLGGALWAQGDRRGAQAAYLRLWKDYPGSEEVEAAAHALESLEASHGIVRTPLSAEQMFARAERLKKAGRLKQALDQLSEIPNAYPKNDLIPEVLYEQGSLLYRMGKNHQALSTFDGLVDDYPGSDAAPEGLYLIARTYWRRGFHHQFTSTCERVIKRYPDSEAAEKAEFALGVYYIERGKSEKARRAFGPFISGSGADSRRRDALWQLGRMDYREGKYDLAHRSFSSLASEATSGYWTAGTYWSARSLERLGRGVEARQLFGRLVTECPGQYYGMEALRRLEALGNPESAAPADPVRPEADFELPPEWGGDKYRRVRILESVGFFDLALEQMRRLLEGAPAGARLEMASLARRAGHLKEAADVIETHYSQWIDARADGLPPEFWSSVFPLPHEGELRRMAREYDLDPLLVAAVVREESRFEKDVVSGAGAVGLMQLMPSTAKEEARRLGLSARDIDLHDAGTNLRLGTYSLARRLKRFDGNLILALCGYNAGDQRAKRWKSDFEGLEQDEFIDQIPFRETRLYVKRILTSYDHYRRIYGS